MSTPKIGIHVLSLGWIRSHEDTPDGRGRTEFTTDPKLARTFNTTFEAFEFYRQQSKTVAIRPDGMPNRPLTAFTIEILPIDQQPFHLPGEAPWAGATR